MNRKMVTVHLGALECLAEVETDRNGYTLFTTTNEMDVDDVVTWEGARYRVVEVLWKGPLYEALCEPVKERR